MRGKDNARTGGEILIDQLSVQGVRHAFCVPGESYLAALDAFYGSDIELTVCRHESTAAIMAEAVGNEVVALRRVRFGPIELGDLPEGEARLLSKDEIAQLREAGRAAG